MICTSLFECLIGSEETTHGSACSSASCSGELVFLHSEVICCLICPLCTLVPLVSRNGCGGTRVVQHSSLRYGRHSFAASWTELSCGWTAVPLCICMAVNWYVWRVEDGELGVPGRAAIQHVAGLAVVSG